MPMRCSLTIAQMEEIKNRYPEQKPVCLNYAHCRQDIFSLLAMVRELREQKEYYRELGERQAAAVTSIYGGCRGGADHV